MRGSERGSASKAGGSREVIFSPPKRTLPAGAVSATRNICHG